MSEVEVIKPKYTALSIKRIGIYCRVSSAHSEQLASLAQQVSSLTKMVMAQPLWSLRDIYIDVKSAETASMRSEFNRLLLDCRNRELDLVVTKSISRFGRDTVEMVSVIRELRSLGIDVLFEQEMISTAEDDSDFLTTVLEAFAQAENESRSANVKKGLMMRGRHGSASLYKRRCFGYYSDENGELQINDDEAAVVRSIFDMYLGGESLVGIIRQLEAREVKTATGKERWSKSTLDKLLSNEKYCGDVVIFKTYTSIEHTPLKVKKRKENKGEGNRFMLIANHPAIISKEVFEKTQAEKARRSNVVVSAEGTKRKGSRYSKKRDAEKNEW